MRGCGRNSKPVRSKKFIYDLPHKEYKDIEDMMNMNDVWETLAGEHLQLRVGEIDKMRRYNMMPGTSAAKALLETETQQFKICSCFFTRLKFTEEWTFYEIMFLRSFIT